MIKTSLHMYEDFMQKKRFKALVKMVNDRKALPIAEYRDDIVKVLAANQVVVIAGDTGCGKSTQVCDDRPSFLYLTISPCSTLT